VKKIKILHITTVPQTLAFLTGGLRYMKARGFEVCALSSPGKLLNEFSQAEQVPVYAVKMTRRITPLRDLISLFQLWRRVQILRPQIVHTHTPKGGLLGMVAAYLARSPVRIYHIHGLPFITARGYKRIILRWCEKVSCYLAHQVFCVSYSVRDVVIKESLCPDSKVKVLVNGSICGIDATTKFNPVNVGDHIRLAMRRNYGIPNDALVIGFVGRVVRDKGLLELVQAWKTLRQEFPTLYLLVVGSFEPQDPLPPSVEKLLRTDPRVCLAGYVDETPPLYAAMDVLVLPSYREGFGLVALEASAMALPVVATNIPGCKDAVQDGVTGILVPPYDAEALARAIRKYLHSSALRRQHGMAGRKRALRDFSPEAIWEALYQEYLLLLYKKGLQPPELVKQTWQK